jgi:hypothetical protein
VLTPDGKTQVLTAGRVSGELAVANRAVEDLREQMQVGPRRWPQRERALGLARPATAYELSALRERGGRSPDAAPCKFLTATGTSRMVVSASAMIAIRIGMS